VRRGGGSFEWMAGKGPCVRKELMLELKENCIGST